MSTSKQLRMSASASMDATADDADLKDFTLCITRGVRVLRSSRRPKGSSPTPPVAVSLTTHTSDRKPHERSNQKTMTLLELPMDILCLVADHLDVVARACLKYAHPALGCWDPGNLSACARSRIIRFLQRDGAAIPKELLGVASKGTSDRECSEYLAATPKHCVICRCHGHLSHCPSCRVRTCARENIEFWQKWTRTGEKDTAFLAVNADPSM